MKTKTLNICLLIISLSFFQCKNYDNDVTDIKNKLNAIDSKLETSPVEDLLKLISETDGIVEGFNQEFKNDSIYFTLNIRNKNPQVVHISPDNSSLPFMVLCKIDATPDATGNGFTINSIKLAIRAIGKSPITFFKIKDKPTLSKPSRNTNVDYDWQLSAQIDLRRSSDDGDGDTSLSGHTKMINGDKMDIHIKQDALKDSLMNIYNLNEDFKAAMTEEEFNEFFDILCCGGVICHTEVVVPRP